MTDNVYAIPDTARREDYENCEMERYMPDYRDRPRERAARADAYEDCDIERPSLNSGCPVHQGSELGDHKERAPSKTLILVITCFSLTMIGIIALVVLYVLSQARWQAEFSVLQRSLHNYQDSTDEDISDLHKSLRYSKNVTEEEIADNKEQIVGLKRFSNTLPKNISDLNKRLQSSQDILKEEVDDNQKQIEGLTVFSNIIPRKLQDIKQRLYGIEENRLLEINSEVIEVQHNMMSERKVNSTCNSYGCHSVTPTYEIRESALKELIGRSSSCRQFIKIRCQGVMVNSGHNTYWISRTGLKMYNWGTDTSGYCQCGLHGTCIRNIYKCNCDQNSNSIITSDEGYLTDKSKLPLREIRVGDLGDGGEMAWLTIGKLECVGQPSTQLRLSPGGSNYGRVEILHLDTWGTICDHGWGWNESNVICKMLGYHHAESFSNYPGPTGQIWLDDVSCTGSESDIILCNRNAWGEHSCTHNNDVAVACTNTAPVELRGGSKNSGRVEIYHNGVWGTVCDDGWDLMDAHVVCRMLRFRNAASIGSFGNGSGVIWLDDVHCSGTESSILDCEHKGFGVHDCDHDEDVGVVCNI